MEQTRNSRLKPMTLTCDLDLVGMVDLWVLHIDLLRRTFEQSLMKIFERVKRYGADKKVLQKDRRTDRRRDEGHFYNPQSASRWGINK